MVSEVFNNIYEMLVTKYIMHAKKGVRIEERVKIFLMTQAWGVGN